MKQTKTLDAAQAQMRRGVITLDGFLGTDRRALIEILETDDAAVKRLGLTHAEIAGRLRELRDAGARGLGLAMDVPPHFEVTVDGVRGKLPCPFGHKGVFAKTYTVVTNKALGETITFTDLNIHLIEAHGFYLGTGAAFRLDPERIARIVEGA